MGKQERLSSEGAISQNTEVCLNGSVNAGGGASDRPSPDNCAINVRGFGPLTAKADGLCCSTSGGPRFGRNREQVGRYVGGSRFACDVK